MEKLTWCRWKSHVFIEYFERWLLSQWFEESSNEFRSISTVCQRSQGIRIQSIDRDNEFSEFFTRSWTSVVFKRNWKNQLCCWFIITTASFLASVFWWWKRIKTSWRCRCRRDGNFRDEFCCRKSWWSYHWWICAGSCAGSCTRCWGHCWTRCRGNLRAWCWWWRWWNVGSDWRRNYSSRWCNRFRNFDENFRNLNLDGWRNVDFDSSATFREKVSDIFTSLLIFTEIVNKTRFPEIYKVKTIVLIQYANSNLSPPDFGYTGIKS